MEEDGGALGGVGFVGEDGDAAVGVEAMDDVGAWFGGDPQAFESYGNTAVGADFELSAYTPDVRPPRAAWCRAQNVVVLAAGEASGGIGGAAQFTMDFLGVAVTAQGGQQEVGSGWVSNGLGGEEGW